MEMVSRPCPLCGSLDQSQVFAHEQFDPARWDAYAFASRKPPEYMHYRLLRCPTCDLVYANPVPTLGTLAAAYQSAAFDTASAADWAARTYVRLLRHVADRLTDRRGALDIGTGDGAFLRKLLALGFTDVVGVEPSAAPIAAADESVRPLIRHGPFRAQDFTPDSFRLITCFQTLEHLYDPLQACRDAYSLLKTGGLVILVVHNRRALSAKALGLRSPIYDIEHLQLFCPRTLGLLLQQAGFQEIRIRRLLNCYPLSYWLRLFPLPRSIKKLAEAGARASRLGAVPLLLPAGNIAAIGCKPSQ